MGQPKITVYGAFWRSDCRQSKQFLGEQCVRYNWVDIDENEEGRKRIHELNADKQIILTIIFEDGSIFVEPSNAELAAKLSVSSEAKREYYDLVIVGSGPVGLTTTCMPPEKRSIGHREGGTTERIDNYPGFVEGIGGSELFDQMKAHAELFDVEIPAAKTVTQIQTYGDYKSISTESGNESCDAAILLAPGTWYRRLGVPGEEDLIGAGIHFCATCDGPFYKDREVVVVGGATVVSKKGYS